MFLEISMVSFTLAVNEKNYWHHNNHPLPKQVDYI